MQTGPQYIVYRHSQFSIASQQFGHPVSIIFPILFSDLIPELDLFPALITLKNPTGISAYTSEQRPDAIRQSTGVILLSIRPIIFQTNFFF